MIQRIKAINLQYIYKNYIYSDTTVKTSCHSVFIDIILAKYIVVM